MLLKLFRRIVGSEGSGPDRPPPDVALLQDAVQRMARGDNRGAIQQYRAYLAADPGNLTALNDLGACLADIGQTEEAAALFELASSLDDTFIPAMVNRAKLLADQYRTEEALALLHRAKVIDPNFTHTDTVYAGVQLKRGLTASARQWQQRAWMAHFDNLRIANSHLFWIGYDDIPEEAVASEHRFWADTLRPLDAPPGAVQNRASPPPGERRIRIGYWSPDFRSHSVRFFFRPLLENHDRSRFEVFVYHDHPGGDTHTERIEAAAEHFHRVHALSDPELMELVASHGLDVLVELAGHTSYNRLALLQGRLATIQMNALGYPPTTGLRTIDAKLVDRHVLTADAARYYTERPVALPHSFWCFDPLEDVPTSAQPACANNGHVTFGSVGNVAKITPRVAHAWAGILERVPHARLQLRSVNFLDEAAQRVTRERLASYGLQMDRVDFRKPLGGQEFFASYNEIDVVLDTFPFNGGTTTCFAAYMGVPVVTITGRSLIGRMGLSILSNLGIGHLAVADVQAYVDCAVQVAADGDFLRAFKRQARDRFRAGPLGDGGLFAREFEHACEALLAQAGSATGGYRCEVAPLPLAEVMRRAYDVLRADQSDAGRRILAHCLEHYPDAAAAHLLQAQLLVWSGDIGAAIAHVEQVLGRFTLADRDTARLALARMHLLREDRSGAEQALAAWEGPQPADAFDAMQLALYRACVAGDRSPSAAGTAAIAREGHLTLLVPCDDAARFDVQRTLLLRDCLCPAGWTLEVRRCSESGRVAAYQEALQGASHAVVMIQKNVQVRHPLFLQNVLQGLESADIVGCTGARRWDRLDWRSDAFEHKAGSFIGRSSERSHGYELHVLGPAGRIQGGMAILNGSVLAVRGGLTSLPTFDRELLGAETLMEEAWTHAAGEAGWRLATHADLGVFIDADVALDAANRAEARVHVNALRGFDPFASVRDGHVSVSAPAGSLAEAVALGQHFFAHWTPR